MLLLEPETLPDGANVFPDDQQDGRHYFEAAAGINVSRLVFQKGSDSPHQFVCEVNFSLAGQKKGAHGALFKTGKTMPVPWESAKVKIWSISENEAKLISKGNTSGYGLHNSLHRASPEFLPDEIYLTTELACKCSSHAAINYFEWRDDAEQVFPELMAETTRMTRQALERGEVFTPHTVALRALENMRSKRLLILEVTGAGAKWLDQQLMIQLASAWVDIAYVGSCERWEPAPPDLEVKCLTPIIPNLKKIISLPLKYRHPILFRLGKVMGN